MVTGGRVNGSLAVSRALGDHALKDCGVSAVPTQKHVALTEKHRMLIVAW